VGDGDQRRHGARDYGISGFPELGPAPALVAVLTTVVVAVVVFVRLRRRGAAT
jgi:hypothetical protein